MVYECAFVSMNEETTMEARNELICSGNQTIIVTVS